jgi:hypothetical protein
MFESSCLFENINEILFLKQKNRIHNYLDLFNTSKLFFNYYMIEKEIFFLLQNRARRSIRNTCIRGLGTRIFRWNLLHIKVMQAYIYVLQKLGGIRILLDCEMRCEASNFEKSIIQKKWIIISMDGFGT